MAIRHHRSLYPQRIGVPSRHRCGPVLWNVSAPGQAHGISCRGRSGLVGFRFGHLIDNPGVPHWWPGFCLAYDVIAGGFLALLLMKRSNFSLNTDAQKTRAG